MSDSEASSAEPRRGNAQDKAIEIIEQQKEKIKRHEELNKPMVGLSGGIYIPPHKLRAMQASMDKNDANYQRLRWDALRKSINGIVNKVTAANIKEIIPELFGENIVR